MLSLLAAACAAMTGLAPGDALPHIASRRALLTNLAVLHPLPAFAASSQIIAPGFEASRVEGIGGGADMLSEKPPKIADVLYPPSMNGTWECKRIVTSVEGDAFQAEGAWRLLGGYGSDIKAPEAYRMRYIEQPPDRPDGTRSPGQSLVGLDGRNYFGVVLDRGFEMDQRVHGATVQWDARTPNALEYARAEGGRGGAAAVRVVQRSVEPPDDKGWGSNELLRITTTANVLGQPTDIIYAARVQRRFRRALTPEGERLVEGLEILKTYRVLDGIAGVEYPTSTTKSLIRMTRR